MLSGLRTFLISRTLNGTPGAFLPSLVVLFNTQSCLYITQSTGLYNTHRYFAGFCNGRWLVFILFTLTLGGPLSPSFPPFRRLSGVA